MTRTFLWVLGAVALAAACLVTARFLTPAGPDDAQLRQRVQALDAELKGLREQLGRRERALGQALPRLVANAPAANAPVETDDEREARVEQEGKAHELKLAAYYSRMDREIRLSPPAPGRRAQLQKSVDALAKQPKPGLAVDGYECMESLCRLEVRRLRNGGPSGVVHAIHSLSGGMAEVSMRPFDGDRSVIYFAPTSHKLPPVDL